jgi:hypothetical protein
MSVTKKTKVEVGAGKHVRRNLAKFQNQLRQTGPQHSSSGMHSGVQIPRPKKNH